MENGKIGGIKTPEPIVTEFGTGDYVGTPHAKIQTDRPSGGGGWSRQMCEILLSRGF